MKTFTIALSLVVLAAAATPAVAAVDGGPGSAQRVEVSAPHAALRAAQVLLALRELGKVYEMSSGRKLAVTVNGETLNVRYGRHTGFNLQRDGSGRFVSHDGRFELQFGLDDHGDPQLVRLTLPAPLL